MPDARPSILFTNMFLVARTGSELHLAELARRFSELGWDVTFYTLVSGYPICAELEKLGAKIVVYGEEDQLAAHYDVLFAQHHMVSDYVWTNLGISFDKVVVSILGAVTLYEKLPLFSDDSDLILAVSPEALDAFSEKSNGIETMVFTNYATDDYFAANRSEPLPEKPQKIAVISNHTVDEVRALANLVDETQTIDYFGYETEAVEVTPELVASYDLIVTIGRTVICCFATCTPVYCYDQFGGPGYIDPAEAEKHAYANFSGRSDPARRSGEELYADIMDGYGEAVGHLEELRSEAETRYRFDALFDRFYEKLSTLPARTRGRDRSTVTDGELAKNELLCLGKSRLIKWHDVATVQVYWSPVVDDSLSEERCVTFYCQYNTRIKLDLETMIPAERGSFLRLDPDMKPCTCRFQLLERDFTNAHSNDGDLLRFLTADPNIFCWDRTSLEFVVHPIDQAVALAELGQELGAMKKQLDEEKNSAPDTGGAKDSFWKRRKNR